jgi:hypothetical protein
MATVRARIVILTVRITLSVCPFNRMTHTANRCIPPESYDNVNCNLFAGDTGSILVRLIDMSRSVIICGPTRDNNFSKDLALMR